MRTRNMRNEKVSTTPRTAITLSKDLDSNGQSHPVKICINKSNPIIVIVIGSNHI